MKFVNEYQLTDAVLKDQADTIFVEDKWKKMLGIAGLFCLTLLISGRENISTTFFFFLPMILLFTVVWFWGKNRSAACVLQRKQQLYYGLDPVIRVEIDQYITVTSNGNEKVYALSSVQKWKEKRNEFLLYMNDNTVVSLRKDGFLTGNSEELKSFCKTNF